MGSWFYLPFQTRAVSRFSLARCLWAALACGQRGGGWGGNAGLARVGVKSPQMEGRPVLPQACPLCPRLSQACRGFAGAGWAWRGREGTGLRRSGAQKILGAGESCLKSCLFPQAEKCEDSVPPSNGELAVRAKLVLPTEPRKPPEAQGGRWPPALQTFVCHHVTVPRA